MTDPMTPASMPPLPPWLPTLVLFEAFEGDWDRYLAALYAFFRQDFIDTSPSFNGVKLSLKRHPVIQNKEATFWHIISEGDAEADRLPDMRRCERIRWPRPVIEHSSEAVVKVWKNKRNKETRVCLWLEDAEYLVILAERRGYTLLWTAFPVTREHRKRKLLKEYEAAQKS
jgi:hypothetical protein